MKQSNPAISAIIPVYNREWTIARAIESVLAQSMRVSEIIVVDDGSTDGTASIVQHQYGKYVKYIHTENHGVSQARLAGVEAARCEWIAFLDSDDEWIRNKTEVQAEVASRAEPDVLWIFSDVEVLFSDGKRETRFAANGFAPGNLEIRETPVDLCLPLMYPLFPASLIKREAILSSDALRYGFRVGEDTLLAVDLALRGAFAATADVVARVYRTADLKGSSVSAALVKSQEFFRARMATYEKLIEANGDARWRLKYEGMVRGLCNAMNNSPIQDRIVVAKGQFKHGWSLKAMLYLGQLLVRGAFTRT
ncbi:MAG TPA: glycosyltransferase family 2 protein [Tepidisphaeraceae bacterium]|nr:glycosyltransferase family 2 protein [Tepidisphaeraceae bacterium]